MVNFRKPTNKEFEMVGKLYFFEQTNFYRISPLHPKMLKDTRNFPAWMKAHACDAFVTEDGNGICCLTPNPDGSKYVHAIWVNPAFRGNGYGKAMLEHAKKLSPKGLALHVNIENPKALCLYYRCGFAVAAMEGYNDGGLYWRIYMETKKGIKGHEGDAPKYDYPPKEWRI